MGISADLYKRIRETMLRCGSCRSTGELRSAFVDSRIASWRYVVPEAGNEHSRATTLIDELHEKKNEQDENALVLLLGVLSDLAPSGTACRRDLARLADEVAQAMAQPAVAAPEPGPRDLGPSEQRALAKALLTLPSMANSTQRQVVISQLPSHIATQIPGSTVDNIHVLNIVTTCLRFDNGLEELLEVLRFTDEGSNEMEQVEALVKRLLE